MRRAREDVLPAIGLEELRRHAVGLLCRKRPPAMRGEIAGIGLGLRLEDAVDRRDEPDEVIDRAIALALRQRRVVAPQLELVEHDVLALVLPVEEEHILEKRGK